MLNISRSKPRRNRFRQVFTALILLYGLLLIPDSNKSPIYEAKGVPFTWDRDQTWQQLEEKFKQAQTQSPEVLDSMINDLSRIAEEQLVSLDSSEFSPGDVRLDFIQATFFSIAPLVAATKKENTWFIDYYNRVRNMVKRRSSAWDAASEGGRNRLYELLYGMRAAVEEVLLQLETTDFDPVMLVKNETSATPSTTILGVKVHSGDLLVSRGGAEVSALISRGNDYPGNFSHVALIYVDAATDTPYLIEAHIEKGVAFATVEEYLKDKKLRFMVLRPRADLPALENDPQLPQKAARFIYDEASKRHIPYDFKMNFFDSTAMFCSEVGSYAYKNHGVTLWQAESTISSQGVVNWLSTFGVEYFVTQMPSDLEYDPQLSVVGEWRDAETLLKDHIDNAVMDALLESADQGMEIDYSIWQLPIARLLKGYCMVLNWVGKASPIPEGMSATQALKNNSFVDTYQNVRGKAESKVKKFKEENGYTPPYWQLVSLAQEARDES